LTSVFFAALILPLALSIGDAVGEEPEKDLPDRAISVAPEYTGIVISEGDDASVDLMVANEGLSNEKVNLTLTSIPDGWKARVKTYSFGVTGVYLESDSTKNLTLKAEPGSDVGPGEYFFAVQAQTEDGELTSSSQLAITVTEKKEKKKVGGVNVVTSYPVLRGPTDATFEFSLEVENKLDKDSIFNLTSQGPENWEINFKPAYEDKFISSLRLKANQSQTVAVAVKPFPLAEPGEYEIPVKVGSPEAEANASLIVELTGTYKLEVGTATNLLSLNAMRGEKASISFYARNTGSAALNNVRFLSFKPENWKVEFNPEMLEALAPQELKQVEVSITPTEQALVGDYSVALSADAGKVSKNLELRVSVKASSAWGWIGIGIILLVVAGLVVIFIRLGRR
jgi:uncharacterized membrane protein